MATRDVDNSPELQRLLEKEKEHVMAKQMVSKLTIVCWDKCITGTPGSKFSAGETACLSNCARRFLDMSMILGKRFQLH
ncbi:unnamed protein product [Urochloa decumbens]|uniref:Mitochondrial import inner membrane translocase subunit n=1 Tax=Urochloa decumbens TaxID=240449 RepID=A0ABC9FU41_9POAL